MRTVLKPPLEREEQRRVIDWCNYFGVLRWPAVCDMTFPIFAISNEYGRNRKHPGLRAGVPDLFLHVPMGSYHGMFIEMKRTKGGRLSDEQRDNIAWLEECGYFCAVCKGADEAIKAITAYMDCKRKDTK